MTDQAVTGQPLAGQSPGCLLTGLHGARACQSKSQRRALPLGPRGQAASGSARHRVTCAQVLARLWQWLTGIGAGCRGVQMIHRRLPLAVEVRGSPPFSTIRNTMEPSELHSEGRNPLNQTKASIRHQ